MLAPDNVRSKNAFKGPKMRFKQRKMNLETILRRSFIKAFKEYVSQSSIGGIKEIFKPNIGWKERFFWIGIFVMMITMMFYYLDYTLSDTLTRPLVVSMESSTHPISKIDFPTVAFCNTNRISKKALKEISRRLYTKVALKNESLERVEHFFLQYGRLIDFSYGDFMRNQPFLDNMIVEGIPSTMEIMEQLSPKCDDMLLKCEWDSEEVDCKTLLSVELTVRGHCCVFNHNAEDSIGAKNKRQSLPGVMRGLRLFLDPMIEDYAYTINNVRGFDVLLLSPGQFADFNGGKVIYRLIEPNKAEFMELSSVQQRASAEVRKYPLKIRQCLFRNENKLHNKPYSYGNCLMNCRINTIRSLCKCTPYYLPNKNQAPVCTLEDLKCLNKYREKFLYLYPVGAKDVHGLETEIEDSLFCDNCLPDCEFTKYSIKSYKMSLNNDQDFQHGTDIFTNLNITGKIMLNIYQSTSTGTLDRLDVIYYWFEILSNIGGFGGILLGFSILGVVEIFYYFYVRFIILAYTTYKRQNNRNQ